MYHVNFVTAYSGPLLSYFKSVLLSQRPFFFFVKGL